jgi:hypothetical protein
MLIGIVLLTMGFNAEAKRVPPRDVEPVIYKDVKYIAPHFKIINKEVRRGYVEAWDRKTNKKLWEIQVYKIDDDPKLEQDVQDIFITSLTIKNDRLVVVNERKERYEIDLQTRKIFIGK